MDRRLLDAAAALFLERGFEATNCEHVAASAGAGKASLYARYASKEELFEAAVRDILARGSALINSWDEGRPLADRLSAVGEALVDKALAPDSVALMRLAVANAARVPDLAREIDRSVTAEAIGAVLAATMAGDDAPPSSAARQDLAERLVRVVLAPVRLGILLNAAPDQLRRTALLDLHQVVAAMPRAG